MSQGEEAAVQCERVDRRAVVAEVERRQEAEASRRKGDDWWHRTALEEALSP
jgi:hypothetical protein